MAVGRRRSALMPDANALVQEAAEELAAPTEVLIDSCAST